MQFRTSNNDHQSHNLMRTTSPPRDSGPRRFAGRRGTIARKLTQYYVSAGWRVGAAQLATAPCVIASASSAAGEGRVDIGAAAQRVLREAVSFGLAPGDVIAVRSCC